MKLETWEQINMTNIEYSKVIMRYLEDMKKIGINKYIAAPPIYYILWKARIRVPPPLYQNIIPLYFLMVLEFTIPVFFLYAIFDFFIEGEILISYSESIELLILGLAIGVTSTMYYKFKAVKHKHVKWKNYIFDIGKFKKG